MHPERDLIAVGKIVGTHGVAGAVKVISLSDSEQRFTTLDRVFLVSEADETNRLTETAITANIESSFMHKGRDIVKFQQWDNINDVEKFRDYYIKIPREERPLLEEGAYYFDEIIGLSVSTVQGEYLGEVTNIYQTGSNDVYEVSKPETKQPVLIPALHNVVVEIDLEQGDMVVNPPDGLLNEEE